MYEMPPFGPYQYHEVLSSLRKEIKLGRLDEAVYWAQVILTKSEKPETGQKTLAKQLWIMASEDMYSTEVTIRAFIALETAGKVRETDQFIFLVALMCRAPKWWETGEGRAVDIAWAKAEGDLKDPDKNHKIPSYALDRHTRRGWEIFKKTGDFDDRFSGTDLGRQKTVFLFKRDGKISPDGKLDKKDPAWLEHWNWFRNLLRAKSNELEPNDPLGPVGLLPAPDDGGLFPEEDKHRVKMLRCSYQDPHEAHFWDADDERCMCRGIASPR